MLRPMEGNFFSHEGGGDHKKRAVVRRTGEHHFPWAAPDRKPPPEREAVGGPTTPNERTNAHSPSLSSNAAYRSIPPYRSLMALNVLRCYYTGFRIFRGDVVLPGNAERNLVVTVTRTLNPPHSHPYAQGYLRCICSRSMCGI